MGCVGCLIVGGIVGCIQIICVQDTGPLVGTLAYRGALVSTICNNVNTDVPSVHLYAGHETARVSGYQPSLPGMAPEACQWRVSDGCEMGLQ